VRSMQAKERRRAVSPEVVARIKRESSSGRVDSGGRGARGARPSLGLPLVATHGSSPPSGGTDAGLAPSEDEELDAPAERHFGLVLRRVREQQGLSLHDVAEQTRISVRWLSALEEARTEQLPAPVFVIGYLRSYARVLGLSGDELIAGYRRHRGLQSGQPREGLPPTTEPLATQEGRALAQRRALLITVALVLIGAVALAFLLLRGRL
jgi:transcriptional regulator with XRE-family HTH domain